jgi:hypothetical protein
MAAGEGSKEQGERGKGDVRCVVELRLGEKCARVGCAFYGIFLIKICMRWCAAHEKDIIYVYVYEYEIHIFYFAVVTSERLRGRPVRVLVRSLSLAP